MRRIKYLLSFLAGMGVLCMGLIAIVLVIFDNDDYRRLVTRGVKFFTGYSVTIEGPFALVLSTAPSLSAEAIQFHPGTDGSSPPVKSIGKLHIQIALKPLLGGVLLIRQLLAEDVAMAVTIGQDAEAGDDRVLTGRGRPDIEIPIMENVRLRNIRLDVTDAAASRTIEIRLRNFDIDDIRDTGPLFINGEGSVSGIDFEIDGRLGALAAMLRGAEPFAVYLNLTSPGFQLSISGTVEDLMDGKGLDLKLSGEAGEISNLFKLIHRDVPPLGHIKLEATITHDINAPQVSYLDVKLSGDSLVEFSANGSIANAITGEGTDIQFSGSCENPDIFKLLLPEHLPVLNRIRMAGKLREAQGEFAFENVAVDAVAGQGMSVTADGRIGMGDNLFHLSASEVDVNIKLSMPTIAPLKPYVIDSLPEMGPISAKARLTGPPAKMSLEDIDVEAGGSGPFRVTSKGRIGRLPGPSDMTVSEVDLTASMQGKSTRSLVSAFGIEVPELGDVSVRTRILGSSDRFQLAEIDVRTAHAKGLEIGLTGNIAFEQHQKLGLIGTLDLQARADAPSMGAAFVPLGISDMPRLRPLRASALVQGTTEVLSISKIAFRVGQSSSLRMEVNGEIGRIPLTGERPITDVKLAALVRAKSTSALSTILGVSIPDLGPLQATGRLIDRTGIIGVRDVKVLVGDEKSPALKVAGTIASVLKDYDVAVDGIALVVEARDLDLQLFSDLIGQPLPDVGPMNGSFQVAGSPVQLAVSKANLSTVSPRGLTVTVAGGVDHIRLDGQKSLKDVNVSLSAVAPNSGALSALIDFELPDLGPVQMTASVNDAGGSLDVKTFDIRSGSDQAASLRMQGQIRRITDLRQIALEAAFETASLPWAEKYMQRPQADNFPLTGMIKVRGAADGLIIDEARFGTTDGKGLILEAQGRLTRLSASPEFDLRLTASASDPHAIGSMVGVSLPLRNVLAVNGRLNGNARKVVFKGETRIGETVFTSRFNGAFAGKRPRIDGKFTTAIVNLEDMGIYPEAPADDAGQTADPGTSKKGPLFNDTPLSFEALRAIDLHLALDADKLIGRNVTIEKLDLDMLLENGRLRIHPINMIYAAGFSSSEFVIDNSGSTPEFILKVTAEDIDVEDILAYAHEPIIMSGFLNLVVDLHSSGRSPHEIASNLEGEIGLALENGRIRRTINFLSLDAFDTLLNKISRSRHTDLNCMINQIHFENGVGEIEVFYMDSPRIRARGAGNVNLTSETIDVVVHPEAKRRLFRRGSPVRINGPLTRPSVRMIPSSEAVMLYGDIFMPYVTIPKRILGLLWSLIRNDRPPTPCVFEKR